MPRRYSIPIREGPEEDRLREKLIATGSRSITDAELLGIPVLDHIVIGGDDSPPSLSTNSNKPGV